MLNPFRTLTRSRIQPIRYPELARTISVRLPGGVNYPAGQVLGERSAATPADEVQTLTVSGSPTGGTFTIGVPLQVGSVTPTVPLAYNASAAVVQAALETILGIGNVTVSLSGAVYTITFIGDFAKSSIPLLTLFANGLTGGSSPTVTPARGTSGTPGAGLFAAYNDALSDGVEVARVALEHNVITDFSGRMLQEYGSAGPITFPAYNQGDFLASELPGLDANAVTDLGKLVQGAAFNTPGAVIRIGV
jgi:hypothetical protein